MSGTSFGTVVLHVAPESAIGGPLAAVCTGDEIALDVTDIGFIGLRRYKCAKNRIGFGPQGDETGQ